jgi:arylsulfatase A-like enzyme
MDRKEAQLSPDVRTLAELLSAAGYRTRAFHEGGYVSGRFGFDRGFDEYEEFPRIAVARESLDEVLAWMREARSDRYFLFVHTYAAHYPYGGLERFRSEHAERGLPSDRELKRMRRAMKDVHLRDLPLEERLHYLVLNQFVERHDDLLGKGTPLMTRAFLETDQHELDLAAMRRSYDDRIRLVDQALGRMRDTLVELGQWEDTLFIVLSDHGEAFFEHGLERHDYVPFNEVLKVPCVITFPALTRDHPTHVIEGLTWHLDVLPTVLGLAGVEAPPELAGLDLTPVLAGRGPVDPARSVFPGVLRPPFRKEVPLRRVALSGRHKWIEGHEHFGDVDGLLFDLAADAAELVNERDTDAARVEDLKARTSEWVRRLHFHSPLHQRTGRPLRAGAEAEELELSERELEKLRALGYTR